MSRVKKIELSSLLSNDLLTIIRETENKRICQISGIKSGRGPIRNLSGGRS